MEVSEQQLDNAIEGISEAICTVAHAVLDPEDAEMFLDELNKYFATLNELAEQGVTARELSVLAKHKVIHELTREIQLLERDPSDA